jgi:hypothetical protein
MATKDCQFVVDNFLIKITENAWLVLFFCIFATKWQKQKQNGSTVANGDETPEILGKINFE